MDGEQTNTAPRLVPSAPPPSSALCVAAQVDFGLSVCHALSDNSWVFLTGGSEFVGG
jgi:hypothetical protein